MDEKVAAIFWHIRPLLPMPVTTILPDVFNIRSTALEKFALSLLARPDMARASICKTRLAVCMDLSDFIKKAMGNSCAVRSFLLTAIIGGRRKLLPPHQVHLTNPYPQELLMNR